MVMMVVVLVLVDLNFLSSSFFLSLLLCSASFLPASTRLGSLFGFVLFLTVEVTVEPVLLQSWVLLLSNENSELLSMI